MYPSSLIYPSIPSHFIPIHIQSLLYLFISSVLISLFVIALNFSFPFILISTHPILSLLLCYSLSILQSIFSSLSFHPPSLLYSILIHPLIILPIHSFPHPLSPILFSFHPSSYSISTPLSFPLLPLSSTSHSLIRFSPSILLSSLFPDSFLFSFYSYISIPFFLIYSRNIYSIHSLLSYPFTHILLSSRLLYSAEELHSNKSKGQLLVQRELGLYLPNCELCITPAPSDWILFLFRLYSV